MNISCFIVWVRSRLMWNPSSLMLLIHVRLNGDLNRYPSTDDGISQMRGKWMSRVQQITDIYVKVWNNVNNHAVIAWLIHILNRSADIGCLQTPRSSPAWGVIFGMLRCGGFKMNQLCESFILHAKSQPRAIRQWRVFLNEEVIISMLIPRNEAQFELNIYCIHINITSYGTRLK